MGIIVWLVRGCNFWTTKVMSLCSDGILLYIRGMVYCRGERIDYRNDAADFFFFFTLVACLRSTGNKYNFIRGSGGERERKFACDVTLHIRA